MIDKYNYESYLLDYIDGELTQDEQKELLQYIKMHPETAGELASLQKTKPTEITDISFPGKDKLYRKENTGKVVLFTWKKITVAAAAACLIFVLWFYFGAKKDILSGERPELSVNQNTKPAEISDISPTQKEEKKQDTNRANNISALTAHHSQQKKISPKIKSQKQPDENNSKTLATITPLQEKIKTSIPLMDIPSEVKAVVKEIPQIDFSKIEKENTAHLQNITHNKLHPLDRIAEGKNTLDSTITEKLYTIQNKIAHSIKPLNIKEINIGKLSLVFN